MRQAPGMNVIKLFFSSLRLQTNKLECLNLAAKSNICGYALPKVLKNLNTLAYLYRTPMTRSYITMTPILSGVSIDIS